MEDGADQLIEQLVHRVRARQLSRGDFAKMLAGMGASATGIATLLASTNVAGAAQTHSSRGKSAQATAHRHKQLHHAHVQRQGQATHAPQAANPSLNTFRAQKLQEIMADYADTAIVEDPLWDAPIVGKKAIAQRKMAEMTAMHGVAIEIVHRFAHRNQVVAEWVVRGTHQGPFMGYAPTGRSIEVRGMTVVTRENDKITKESLFYDLADLHRQLS